MKTYALPTLGPSNLDHMCELCPIGKAKKLLFGKSSRVSSFLLDLVHLDVWVSPITLNEGHRYYALSIDDYSRFT